MLIDVEEYDENRLRTSLERLRKDLKVSVDEIISRVVPGLFDGVSKSELLTLMAETCATMATRHPHYSVFAARVACRELYKTTPDTFSKAMSILADAGLVTPAIKDLAPRADKWIDNSRDEELTYFGFKTLSLSYLLQCQKRVVERPQYLFMRVALSIHGDDDQKVRETYDLMSQRYFTHATPTLFNAGRPNGQYSSCFLIATKDDSIEGIFETLKECAMISKHSGGIGMHVSNVRAKGSDISTSGTAGGLVPMLRVFNNMSRFVDQGGNKRPGAISVTLEPWHADILSFLDLRKNHGKEEYRARDLFYALWVPDLFMKTVKENGTWYLFSPDTAPGLNDVYGEEFDNLYNSYVDERRYVRSYPAQKLWDAILTAQIETGNPSIMYKDSCNMKSNQKNLGTIKSSNLCTEIVEYSSPEETAVCNLASIALPTFVKDGKFDFELLHRVSKVITENLEKVIDLNYYPLASTEDSNRRNRPMGIGVQGLADAYMALGYPFDSQEAMTLNKQIFETIYHGTLEKSMELAMDRGSYKSFEGSPAADGKLQFDLWNVKVSDDLWNWTKLKMDIKTHGLRNSLVTALMPTAGTSQILGCTECFEPLTSNIYSRRVLSGEFQVVNKYLVSALEELGLWNEKMKQRIMADQGSIQRIAEIPEDTRAIFKTVWEIKQRVIIDQGAARGPFVDQSQSMNIFLANPSRQQLTSMHFYGWEKGLKTGLYYLRTRPAAMPTPFTLDLELTGYSKRPHDTDSPLSTPRSSLKRVKCDIDQDSCDFCSA